jgi:hypothetical protein
VIRLKPRVPKLSPRHPQARGLALDWPLYEGGGASAHDLTSNAYTGTLTGTWAAGRFGWGAKTNGSTTEISLVRTTGQTNFPNIQIGDFTIAVGFLVTTLGSYTPIFDCYDSVAAARNYSLFLNAGGGAAFVYWNAGGGTGTDGIGIGTTILVNTWYDIVVTRKGTLSSFYINGKLGGTDSTQTGTATSTTSTRTLSLGGNPSGGGTKEPTTYDYFRLWNRAHSAAEVAQFSSDPFALYRRSDSRVGVVAAPGTPTPYDPWPLWMPLLAQ